jgi:glutathione S-transferase
MMEIHGVPVSVHTRKVLVAAIEKRLDFRNEPVIPYHAPENWERISPTGKIPVLAEGTWMLPDSSVICAYLERVQPAPALYPTAARDYAQALWFEEYADGTLYREAIHPLFFQKIIRPGMLKQETDVSAVNAVLGGAMPRIFGYLNSVLEGDFLAGQAFSIADIATASNLINFHYLGYEIDARAFPRLAAYFRRQLERPSIARALAAEKPVAASMGLDTAFVDYLALAVA